MGHVGAGKSGMGGHLAGISHRLDFKIGSSSHHGEFDFDLVHALRIGQPATFQVHYVNLAIKVEQWIVVRPCDLKSGRKDSLPDVGRELISIVVLPRGKPLNASSTALAYSSFALS
jgi:hypothetical protein